VRILHTEASLGWGGQEIRILTEAATFLRNGHEVRLVADPGSDIYRRAAEFGVEATALPLRKKGLSNGLALRRLFCDWRPDVVVPHSSIDHWLSAAARLGLPRRPAVVRARHISAPVGRNPPTRWVYRRGADHVVTTGRYIARKLVEDGFLPESRVTSVPTGIDLERFRPGDRDEARSSLGLPGDAFIVAAVATLRSWKGHADLVDAFARAAIKDALLLLVGDGPQRENLEAQIARLGVGASVKLVGHRPDVVPYLRAADLFALPSYANEGVPQALLQAIACGTPALTSNLEPVLEVVERFPEIRTFPARDVPALANALTAAAAAGPPPASAARAPSDLGLEAMYAAMLAVFERLLGAGPRR
jgi:glycosyltransferase involved in cell wall biosynthesis